MEPNAENELTLDDLLQWHAHLVTITEAGIPLELGLPAGGPELRGQLDQIAATVAIRMSRGLTLHEAIVAVRESDGDVEKSPESDHAQRPLPEIYCMIVEAGIRHGDLAAAIPLARKKAIARTARLSDVARVMSYPIAICLVAYVGLIVLCQAVIPVLVAMVESGQQEPGPALAAVLLIREWLPLWAVGVPCCLLIWLFMLRNRRRNRLRGAPQGGAPLGGWIGWVGKIDSWQAQAIACQLMEQEIVLAAAKVAEAPSDAEGPGPDRTRWQGSSSANTPFLHWAVNHSDDPAVMARSLRLATEVYEREATFRDRVWSEVLPAILLVFVGFTVVLGYMLALFGPLWELLYSLA